jgi:hypothetical protein
LCLAAAALVLCCHCWSRGDRSPSPLSDHEYGASSPLPARARRPHWHALTLPLFFTPLCRIQRCGESLTKRASCANKVCPWPHPLRLRPFSVLCCVLLLALSRVSVSRGASAWPHSSAVGQRDCGSLPSSYRPYSPSFCPCSCPVSFASAHIFCDSSLCSSAAVAGHLVKNWKVRWWILKNDNLFYFKKRGVRPPLPPLSPCLAASAHPLSLSFSLSLALFAHPHPHPCLCRTPSRST